MICWTLRFVIPQRIASIAGVQPRLSIAHLNSSGVLTASGFISILKGRCFAKDASHHSTRLVAMRNPYLPSKKMG